MAGILASIFAIIGLFGAWLFLFAMLFEKEGDEGTDEDLTQ